MAHFYTYIDPKEIEAQFQKKDDEDNKDFKDQYEKPEPEMVKKLSNERHDKETKLWTS